MKLICDASLNALKGDVVLGEAERGHLRKYRESIIFLTSKKASFARKRALLLSDKRNVGGYYFVPALLTAVLSSLGSRLFSG